jgi:hypothetical protein
MPVEPQAHEIARAQGKIAVERALLRHIADVLSSLTGRPAVHEHTSRRRLE